MFCFVELQALRCQLCIWPPTKPQTQFCQHGKLEVTVNWWLMVSASRKRKQMNRGHDYRAPGRVFCVVFMAPLNAHHVLTYRLFMSQVSILGKNSRDQEMPTRSWEMSKKEIKEILSSSCFPPAGLCEKFTARREVSWKSQRSPETV